MVSQTGTTGFLLGMANTAPNYAEQYRTYELTGLSGCQSKTFVVAISEAQISRILPALAELNPQPVQIPGS